jgi:hypothetical protein
MAARSLSDFANRMERRADNLPREINRLSVLLVRTIVADLVYVTPVDTSTALSNWQVGLNGAIDLTRAPYSPGAGGSTKGASASAAIAAADAELEGRSPASVGNPIYISNALPYIRRLNDGYSRQAPAGFVERSVLLSRSVLRGEKLKLL